MTLKEAYEMRRLECLALKRENEKLAVTVEKLRNSNRKQCVFFPAHENAVPGVAAPHGKGKKGIRTPPPLRPH